MNSSAKFVNDIVTKLLNKPLSSNRYYKIGGSKNIFRQCVERDKGIGATCSEALSNLIIKETKYDKLKRNLVLDYIKQYLTKKEKEYVERNPDDIKTIIIFATSKFSNTVSIPDISKIDYHQKKDFISITQNISELYEKAVLYLSSDPMIGFSLTKSIIDSIIEYIVNQEKIKLKATKSNSISDVLLSKKILNDNIAFTLEHIENLLKIEFKSNTSYKHDFIDSCFSSLRIIVKWFLSDYLKSTYKIETLPFQSKKALKSQTNYNLPKFRIVDINDLIDLGWTLEDIVEEGMKIDFETIDDITIEHNGDFEQWLSVARENSETIRYLLNNQNELVGYWHFTPLSNNTFQKAKRGELLDSEITIEKIPFLIPGTYNIYFIAICLKAIYRRRNMTFGNLLFSIIETIEEMAKNNIFVNEICALAYSNSGIQLCNSIGLKYLKDHLEHGQIYCGSIYDLLEKPFCKEYPDLKRIYYALKDL